MKIKYFFALVATALIMTTCQSKGEQSHIPDTCDFINKRNCIKVNYECNYDVIPRVTLNLNTARESDIGIKMEIFNYGGRLRINDYAIENIYSSALAPISHFYVVTSENISITNTFNDETYGKWARARVFVPEFNRLFEDVFISPLAYNYMQKEQEDDSDCLVLVRLISLSNNCTFNGIFYGDYLTKWIINSNYQHIVTPEYCFNVNNCREFWTPLLTDEEQKIYENYFKTSNIGLISSSYELPKTIVEKIIR